MRSPVIRLAGRNADNTGLAPLVQGHHTTKPSGPVQGGIGLETSFPAFASKLVSAGNCMLYCGSMAKRSPAKPTDGELEILQILWKLQTATVRDVHDELVKSRRVAQTSVATMMQLMLKKGLLQIVDDRRPQKYAATVDSGATKSSLLAHLIKSVFQGSPRHMLMHLFTSKKMSPARRAKIEKLLEDMDDQPPG